MSARTARGGARRGVVPAAHAAPVDQQEIEWQLEADDLERVRRRLRRRLGAHVAVGPESSETIHDVYCDTSDWRFHRAGYALRLRRAGATAEVTLKALARAEGALSRRREISEPLAAHAVRSLAAWQRSLRPSPDAPVATRVCAVAGRRPLRRLFEVTTARRTFPLRVRGAHGGEVALDATTITGRGRRVRHPLRRVEIEVRPELVETLRPVVARLRATLGLTAATHSKFGAGLDACGLEPAPPAPVPTVVGDAEPTVGGIARATVERQLARLLAAEPGTRLGDDPEALHDMRVATRRLRAALGVFADVLPASAPEIRRQLRQLGSALGAVRDLDVQIREMTRVLRTAEPAARDEVTALLETFRRRREVARRRMLRTLDGPTWRRVVRGCRTLARYTPAAGAAAAERPVRAAAPRRIARIYRKLTRRGDAIGPASAAADYHAVRIRCKRLRYALEFHADVYGGALRPLLRRLIALQDVLGDHQDAQLAAARLRDLGRRSTGRGSRRIRTAAARLAAWYDARARERRAHFAAAYRKVRGRRWKRLRRTLKARRAGSGQKLHSAG